MLSTVEKMIFLCLYYWRDVVAREYTMDIEHAVIASKWLGATTIVPMHYNTFDAIKIDITDFERQIREIGKVPLVLKVEN